MDNISVIGIRKSRILINMLLGVALVGCIIFCAIMWACYQMNSDFEFWLKNGVEVEAEITDAKYFETVDNVSDSVMYDRRWVTYYKYTASDNTVYSGTAYVYRANNPNDAEQIAKSKIGTTVAVIIDPNSNNSRLGKLKAFKIIKYEKK